MAIGVAVQAMLVGMPAPRDLHSSEVDGQVFIAVGATVLFSYPRDDAGLRNVAAVTLPEMGFTGRRVAAVLGITEEYVSMLRARARCEGSAGLMRRRGRPSALGAGDLTRARTWRVGGDSDTAIGERLGVHATTVARALAGVARPGTGAEQTLLADPVVDQAAGFDRGEEPDEAARTRPGAEPAVAEATRPDSEPVRGEPAGTPRGGFAGPGRGRLVVVWLCGGDAAVSLPAPGGCRGVVRGVDRWAGAPL